MSPAKPHHVYFSALADICATMERQIAKIVPHMGERGRLLEDVFRDVLRRMLPGRFAIGSGIMINSEGATSSQTDIIIYDTQFNSQILTEYSGVLFPIECVYAAIEVKETLKANDIRKIVADINKIRDLSKKKQYVDYAIRAEADGKAVAMPIHMASTLSPRTYVFAFSTSVRKAETLKARLTDELKGRNAHVHALYVLNSKRLISQKPHRAEVTLSVRDDAPLVDFLRAILSGVSSMEMGQMNVDPYLT